MGQTVCSAAARFVVRRLRSQSRCGSPQSSHAASDGAGGQDCAGQVVGEGGSQDCKAAEVELWKTGKGKDPKDYEAYKAKDALSDADVDDNYVPDENYIEASYTPGAKRTKSNKRPRTGN
jgi:hypothetical protein